MTRGTRGRRRAWWPAVSGIAAVASVLLVAACLGTLSHDSFAEAVALAPAPTLNLPVRDSRPYWLLRRQPGWLGAHKVIFGGAASDRGRTIIRAARFRDEASAALAAARLTPAYMQRLWPAEMQTPPQPVAFPVPLPGDTVLVTEYGLRLPPEEVPTEAILVQLIVLRVGRTVIVIDSVGIPREELALVVEALVGAVRWLEAVERPER